MSKTKWCPRLVWMIVGLALLLVIPITVVADEGWGQLSEPADLSASNLHISPQQVLPNQQVEISINVGNHGGETGSHTVALYINGYLEQSQTVGISPGSCQNVMFRVAKANPGTYAVSLEGQCGWFTVVGGTTTALTCFSGGLGVGGVAVIAIFVVALVLAIVFVFSRSGAGE